jgi:DNA-binding MarR family transcriptional regulator
MSKGNAIALISRIREKANRFIVHELEEHGITGIVPSHGDILHILMSEERCTMKELAEKIHRTKANVTVLVDKLVECGYVNKEKSTEDNRVTYVTLTEKGKSLRPVFFYISKKLNRVTYGSLSDAEAESLETMLRKIHDGFPGEE